MFRLNHSKFLTTVDYKTFLLFAHVVADETIKQKEINNMTENTKEPETESRPEDAQASEQVKAVSGCDGWVLLDQQVINITNGKYTIKHEMPYHIPEKYPISIQYGIDNYRITNHNCDYLIKQKNGRFKSISKLNDKQIKIELIFNINKTMCVEKIYFRHCR